MELGRCSRKQFYGFEGCNSYGAPILRLPDFERQFIITTDASDVAIRAILEQDFGSSLQPIAFSSRKLNPTEIRYSAYERELLGIV